MAWEFEVIDRTGRRLGPLEDYAQGTDRTVRPRPLNLLPGFTFSLPTRHRFARRLLDLDRYLIVGWMDGENTPRYCGPVVTAQKAVTEQTKTVAFTSAGAGWRLAMRLVGKSVAGFARGTALAPVDRGTIASGLLGVLNTESDTGLRMGTVVASSSTYVEEWRYKPFSEVLAELSAPLAGFDWEIQPVDPYADATGVVFGLLNLVPAIGGLRREVSWEYGPGTRLNVREWSLAADANSNANRVYGLPPNFPGAAGEATGAVVTQSDPQSTLERGRLEAVIATDQPVDAFRQALVNEHVRIRKAPRQTLTMTPVREGLDAFEEAVPRYGIDWREGDIMPFTAWEYLPKIDAWTGEETGEVPTLTVNADFRARTADLALDEFGGSTATIGMIEET